MTKIYCNRISLAIILCLFSIGLIQAQVLNTATMDTVESTMLGRVGIGGYLDTYYSYNFNEPNSGDTPYLVSSARHNEFNINLAYIDIRYRSNQVRARFVPGFGTYMNANYRNEPGTLAHIVEGYVGVKPFKRKSIWIDMGVLGSPYTNESAISKDHLMYTRSLAPENVPYYLQGIKASIPLAKRLNLYVYLLNGWQVIEDTNKGKAIGTQVEFRPNSKMLFNWNTYMGDERSNLMPDYRMRYFSDIFWIYQPTQKISITSCVYGGIQQKDIGETTNWWQGNLIGRYSFTEKLSLSLRGEYFHDVQNTIVTTETSLPYTTASLGFCLNSKVGDNVLLRLDYRNFFSQEKIYTNTNGQFTEGSTLITSSLTIWF